MLKRPTFGGLALAVLFWWKSLTPSMLPRSWLAQACVSAVCIAFALIVGTIAGHYLHRLLVRISRQPSLRFRTNLWRALPAAALAFLVAGAVVWPRWQNEQRALVSMDRLAPVNVIPMLIATVPLTMLLVVIGRGIWKGIRGLDRRVSKLLPRSGAIVFTLVAAVLIGRAVLGVGFGWMEDRVRSTFGAIDNGTDEGVEQPQTPTLSGSPTSFISWESLGRPGRNFINEVTSQEDLIAFRGADAIVREPVRVYAGLRSADTAAERSALAVKDLERAGGFDRAVLVVTTVTGTGWVDPDAATAIEQLYGGDTAIIAIQYSYLPSWISTLADGDVSTAAGSELFEAVHQRWSELPEDARPQLLVFGQSLGSFGAEGAFAGLNARASAANLVGRTQGALFTGPTNNNIIWRQLTAERDPGSPVWRPVYDGGESIRFANQPAQLIDNDPTWTEPRILYIQHPSDPVTFWDMPTLWSKPEWMDAPVGYDIPQRVSWFPFVSWAQGVGDLTAGFSAEPGFGHDYRNAFVAGWAAISAPDGWTAADTARLAAFLGRG